VVVDEVELKYSLSQSDDIRMRELLDRTSRFGSFDADAAGETAHCDTYFDRNGRLQRMGWSLRVRECADGARITLKVPHANASGRAAMDRREIENESFADAERTLKDIVALLRDANVVERDAGPGDVLAHGLFGAMGSLGLTALFVVQTRRATWRLTDGGRRIADLVLDRSRYTTGSAEELIDHQMEIELADTASESALNAIATAEYGLESTRQTKLMRGIEFHGATRLKEKVEAKLELPEMNAYAKVVRMLSDEPGAIPGYRTLGAGVGRRITDVYYDTATLDLAKAHCYLRIREENGEKKLHFRRLAVPERSALPLQEEIKGVDADSDFATSWQVVAAVLAKLLRRAPGGNSSGMTAGLRHFGLAPALTADIVRQAWVAQSADDVPNANRHIAKIKVDDVTFEDAGGRTRRHAEIEITGLEDEEGAPEYVGEDAFRIFMYSFRQTCARRIFRGRNIPALHIGTKYHVGLRLFGRIDDSLADFPGEALVRQEPVFSDFEPEARSGLLRTALFVALSALGLLALSAAASGRWKWDLLVLGVALVFTACLVLARDDSALVSRRTRRRLIVTDAMIGVVIVVIGFGSSTAADLIGLIAFPLTVLGLLALNSRETPD
jgi:adenylate cyclase class IV